MAVARTAVPVRFQRDGLPPAPANDGSSISSADSAAAMMMTCSECELPIHGISTKLVASEPTMAPTVFAA